MSVWIKLPAYYLTRVQKLYHMHELGLGSRTLKFKSAKSYRARLVLATFVVGARNVSEPALLDRMLCGQSIDLILLKITRKTKRITKMCTAKVQGNS